MERDRTNQTVGVTGAALAPAVIRTPLVEGSFTTAFTFDLSGGRATY
jgi:hypothetical protein